MSRTRMGHRYTVALEFEFCPCNHTQSNLTTVECTPSLSNREQPVELPVSLVETVSFCKTRLDVPGCAVVIGEVEIVSSSQPHSGGHSGLEQSHLWSSVVDSTTVVVSISAILSQPHSVGHSGFEQSQTGACSVSVVLTVVVSGVSDNDF